jgi:CHRD domain
MKRLAAVAAALMMAAACGSSNSPPTTPTNNTGPITFTAQLSAQNEVPAIGNADANARGTATITLKVTRDAASGNITGGGTISFLAQLSGFPANTGIRAAHIHNAPAGQNAGVFKDTGLSAASPIGLDANGAGTLTFDNVQITQDEATQINANPANFYFNAHSVLNPNGAVRGQLTKQ